MPNPLLNSARVKPENAMRWTLLLSLTLCIFLGSCKKEGSGNATEIVLGEYASMTGDTATFGQSSHKGLVLAIEQVNNSGGLLGKKIKLITEDDQSNQDQANAAVQKLIDDGTYKQILTTWGIADGAITDPVINGATS